MEQKQTVTVIGPAIVDVLAGPIGEKVLQAGSMSMDEVRMTYGGNAHNEAVVLSRLGAKVSLVSKVGADDVGYRLIDHLKAENIDTRSVIAEEGLATGINIVLYDEKGERRFLTNPNGSLRKFTESDALRNIDSFGDIVSFSCMFVSPMIDILATERIFKRVKERPDTILVVDMVKPKKGEKMENIRPLLKYIDYFLPNAEELKMLSDKDTDDAAKELLSEGVKCVIVKTGKDGCNIYQNDQKTHIPAIQGINAIDTTGAGDSFIAGFIYGLTQEMSVEDSCRFACATASCCVEHVGATEGITSADEPTNRYKQL